MQNAPKYLFEANEKPSLDLHMVPVIEATDKTVNCYDNAVVETFFKTLKAELIWRQTWQTRRQVEVALFQYINGFYNPRRRHSALGGKSPLAFEQKAA